MLSQYNGKNLRLTIARDVRLMGRIKHVQTVYLRQQIINIASSRTEVLGREDQATVVFCVSKISEDVEEIAEALFVKYALVKLLPLADQSNHFNEAR